MPYVLMFFLVPIISVVAFAMCLYRYLYARHKNKKSPDNFSKREMKYRMVALVISSVVFGVIAVCFVGLIILLYLAIAYM